MKIKNQMAVIDSHMASMTDTITVQHDQLITITKETDSLYEYTHENFRRMAEKLTELQCRQHKDLDFVSRRTRILSRLYADFESAITAVLADIFRQFFYHLQLYKS